MKKRQQLADRAVGCLMGLACGDALARPLAGLSPGEIQRRYGELQSYVDVVREENEPQRRALKGAHSALTTLSLGLLDSLLYGPGGPSGPDLARRLTALSFPRNHLMPWGTLRGAPASLVRALDAHARAEDWRLAGVREPDGVAMLVAAPLGLLVGDRIEDVVDLAVDVALVTHREPRSIATAVALVGMVRHSLEQRATTAKGLARAALQAAELALQSLEKNHQGVLAGSLQGAQAAMSLAVGRAETEICPPEVDCRDAPDMLLATLLSALASDQAMLPALLAICQRGASADLLAPAMGAVLGARAGAEHLPLGLVDGLLAHQAIEKRVRALFAQPACALSPLYDLEYSLTLSEARWREGLPPPPPSPTRTQLNLI